MDAPPKLPSSSIAPPANDGREELDDKVLTPPAKKKTNEQKSSGELKLDGGNKRVCYWHFFS